MSVTVHDHTYGADYKCSNSSGKCVKEDMMDPVDPEDYAVHHDHSYMCMEKPCSSNDVQADQKDDETEYVISEDDDNEDEGNTGGNFYHLQGRHIIDLEILIQGLERGCHYCKKPLQLSSCIGDTRYGLGSLLHMECEHCEKVTLIPTGTRHGPNVWDVNSKLGAAMLFCGIGETTINSLLGALNLPSVTKTTLKKREREAGIAFEEVAYESCCEALLEEKSRCASPDSVETVSFDAGWQTRGSGRNYASHTGHGSMIGSNTGKVLSYSYRCRICRFCDRAIDRVPKDHDCRKNWEKSSKAMESDMAIEMLQDLKQRGFHVKKLIMDNDSTTISRAKAAFDENLEKHCDFNHTKKNFTSRLFELRKEKKYPTLGPKAINHLTKCFTYAVKGNSDRQSLENNLRAIPFHVTGDHSKCGDWCGFVKQPEGYKPKNLPYGKYLQGNGILTDLQKVFEYFLKNVDRLLNMGSTQANESFNNIVASKHPKNRFYGGSESTAFRVAAAVSQKNIGHDALSKVYENLLLSPGKNTQSFLERASNKRKYNQKVKSSIAYKKRRYELKSSTAKQVSTAEIKEGATYKSGVDLNPSADSIEEIPDATLPPTPRLVDEGGNTFIYFDLETTGLGTSCDIIQLACVAGEEMFNRTGE